MTLKVKQALKYTLSWLFFSSIIGLCVGLSCGFFLYYLDKAALIRTNTPWLLYLLPLAGLIVGLVYHLWGKQANKGNNLLIENYHCPNKIIPLRMGIFVLFATLISHLFGASVGREGTALQMGSAFSDQLQRFYNFTIQERKTLILAGISAGFSGVFGTPIAAIFFALEIMVVGKLQYKQLYPILLTSLISNYVVNLIGIKHVSYSSSEILLFDISTITKVALAGVAFGLCAIVFIYLNTYLKKLFTKYISIPYWQPFVGGCLFVGICVLLKTNIYLGLGVETIQEAFLVAMPLEVFFIKLVLTALVLSAGFKGGEVTPLFFIGATLGSSLALYMGLPIGALASIGFVALLCACTKTPLACIIMAIELFGFDNALYIGLACAIAYRVSGRASIYQKQQFDS